MTVRNSIEVSIPTRESTYFEAVYSSSEQDGRRYRYIDRPSVLEVLEYLPFIGTIVSFGRLFFGIMQINSSLIFVFFDPSFAGKLLKNGVKNIGRSFVGLTIPIFGGFILMAYDKHRRQQAAI